MDATDIGGVACLARRLSVSLSGGGGGWRGRMESSGTGGGSKGSVVVVADTLTSSVDIKGVVNNAIIFIICRHFFSFYNRVSTVIGYDARGH